MKILRSICPAAILLIGLLFAQRDAFAQAVTSSAQYNTYSQDVECISSNGPVTESANGSSCDADATSQSYAEAEANNVSDAVANAVDQSKADADADQGSTAFSDAEQGSEAEAEADTSIWTHIWTQPYMDPARLQELLLFFEIPVAAIYSTS